MKPLLIITAIVGCATFVLAESVEGIPDPAEPRETRFSEPREKILPNGLRVLAIERPGLPLVSAALVIKSGAESDPPQLAGLAAFTAKLLLQGTESRSATQIANEIEALGATLTAEASWDATTLTLSTLSAQSEPAFTLLADIACHPRFAPEEIERLRRQTLDELRVSLEEPGVLARLAAARVLLGEGLYAHAVSGTPASIQRLRRAAITRFHAQHFAAGNALLVIAGNLTSEAAFTLADKTFGAWPQTVAESAPPAPKFSPARKPRTVLIDVPKAGQAAVMAGLTSVSRTAPDYFAGAVTNSVLGGGYSSRLNQEIRVKRGLSYGAGSSLDARKAGGLFTARCQTKNASAGEVAKLMRDEIRRLRTDPVPDDYLTTRRAVLTGAFARSLETNTGYVERVADLALHGLSLDSINQFSDRIRAVTAEDVRAFANAHLADSGVSVVIVGRAAEIAPALRKAAPKLEIIPLRELDLETATLRKAKSP